MILIYKCINYINIFNYNILIIITFFYSCILGYQYNKDLNKLLGVSSILSNGYFLLLINNNLIINENNNILIFILLYTLNLLYIYIILIYLGFNNIKTNILKYLYKTNPNITFLFIISILSLIGIPPLIGFYSKIYLILDSMNNNMNI
jgi:NADH:ubiquinone oxidoreductase subunit 2 (subunit N)